MTQQIIPERGKKIALARLDIVRKWLEYRKGRTDKLKADYEFVQLHNISNSNLYQILGKICRGSLHRWKTKLDGTEDFTKLVPNYQYTSCSEFRTTLTEQEIKIFLSLLLHPNRISIGKAISYTKYYLKDRGQNFVPADMTFRRYAKWFKDNNYDKWVLARDGEKALADKVEPYIKRDASLLEVGDILVADGHKLNFQVINPFTGKPCRATIVGFLDWASTALVGYEIMLEENTQSIASALRNAILNLDMVPKVVYQDNGRAFRAKYFTDDKGFNELGFRGLYGKLGIETVFAKPYNARAKTIERFFKEFQEGFEKLLPSYIGSSIAEKPAYMLRNEKIHTQAHNEYVPTIDETRKIIDLWLNFKNSQPCPNAPDKTIAEVLENRKRQNIDADNLDDLMLATEVKTIQRNGIRFLGCDYFDERLYGFKSRVLIKYSLFDLSHIKVYTTKGEFLCRAERVTETHPMAKILGSVQDLEDFKQKIEKQKKLRRRTINSIKNYLPKEDLKFIETQMIEQNEIKQEFKQRLIGDKPMFKNSLEKYEWLTKNEPQNQWLQEFKSSKEYKIYYE
jgi:putative transposase